MDQAALGGFSLGSSIGWSAPCVEIMRHQYHFRPINLDVIASMFPVGAVVGTYIVPALVDRVGRKRTMLIMTPAYIGGWILLICAHRLLALFILGRLVTGACGGMFCVLVPMYIAEISENEIRGDFRTSREFWKDTFSSRSSRTSYLWNVEWEFTEFHSFPSLFLRSLKKRDGTEDGKTDFGTWDKNLFTMRD